MLANHKEFGLPSSITYLNQLKARQSMAWFDNFEKRSLSVIKRDQNNDPLPNEGLTHEGLKMIEMQSSFMSIETEKQEVSVHLRTILNLFKIEGLFVDSDSKPAFFVSGKDDIDTTLLNYHLLQAFTQYNSSIKPEFVIPLPIPNLRNFFLKRTQLAANIDQAYFSLKALAQTSSTAPFLQLTSKGELQFSVATKANAIYQFFDMLGQKTSFIEALKSVSFVSSFNRVTVNREEKYKF
jgi:hypothetical protein